MDKGQLVVFKICFNPELYMLLKQNNSVLFIRVAAVKFIQIEYGLYCGFNLIA